MLERLKGIVSLFTRITTGILFIAAVYIHIFWGHELTFGVEMLWQVLILSVICAIGTPILPYDKMEKVEISKQEFMGRHLLHFLYVMICVFVCALWFGWCTIGNWKQIVGMLIAIVFVYGVVTVVSFWVECQTAEKMNAKLKEREEDNSRLD